MSALRAPATPSDHRTTTVQSLAEPRPVDVPTLRPRHVAIIMDGNGRWAAERGMTRTAGHRAGTENIRPVVQRFAEHGVEYLTLYAFSTENWQRSKREVDGLLRLLNRALNREVKHFHRNNIRLLHLGRLDALAPRLQKQVEDAIYLTQANTRMTVSLAFNYGSRAEIVDAARRMIKDGIAADAVDEQLVSSYLYTADLPDPDLIIRTGGDMRLSNFLLWQAAYAEFYSTLTYWPAFGPEEIDEALRVYAQRDRRFGTAPHTGHRSDPRT